MRAAVAALITLFACSPSSAARLIDPVDYGYGFAIAGFPSVATTQLSIGPDGRAFAVADIFYLGPTTSCNNAIGVAAFLPDGSADRSFGVDGKVSFDAFGLPDCPRSPVLTAVADGRVVVAFQTNFGTSVVRMTPTGKLDATFGVAGVVQLQPPFMSYAKVLAMPDGKLVIAGARRPAGGAAGAVVWSRLLENGSADSEFAVAGYGAEPLDNLVDFKGLVRLPDGRLAMIGVYYAGSPAAYNTAVLRLLADGQVDRSFGNRGAVTDIAGSGTLLGTDLAEHQGKLVLAGHLLTPKESARTGLYRLDESGRPDPSFGAGGFVALPLCDCNSRFLFPRIAVDAADRIWVNGESNRKMQPGGAQIVRVLSTGAFDQDFGVAGLANVLPPLVRDLYFGSWAIDAAGRAYLAIAGFARQGDYSSSQVVVARLLESGGGHPGLVPGTAIEYYSPQKDHYFMTADPAEARLLDNGVYPGWSRTGMEFPVVMPGLADPSLAPVCRFYGRPEKGLDSHFYSAFEQECAQVIARFSASWIYESANVFMVQVPSGDGTCLDGTFPLGRYYNGRADANHRYAALSSYEDSLMRSRGWTREGLGPNATVMCAPLF